jgi:transcription termination/antitermination protein NusA
VDTLDRDVDPVGACIGARGSRIQAVVNELRGEKIDVIRWSPDPATYIANSLSPARVDEVRLVNTEDRQVHVLVAEDQLSLAIGKEGQNVRLAARLTGWKIDIKDIAKYDAEAEDRKIAEQLEQQRLSDRPSTPERYRQEGQDWHHPDAQPGSAEEEDPELILEEDPDEDFEALAEDEDWEEEPMATEEEMDLEEE